MTGMPFLLCSLQLRSSVRTHDVAGKTCRKRWMIETDDERELGKSVLAARQDDDV